MLLAIKAPPIRSTRKAIANKLANCACKKVFNVVKRTSPEMTPTNNEAPMVVEHMGTEKLYNGSLLPDAFFHYTYILVEINTNVTIIMILFKRTCEII